MAVVIETTLGDITVDLYLDQRPVTCLNFLKLCKMKYYNYNLFHTIRSGFIAQTGDPSGEGSGGQSIFGLLEGPDKRFFSGEKMPKIRHTGAGLLSMVGTGDMMIGSQFFFTLAPDLDSLDGLHCVIGEVTEGHDVLRKLNDVICDEGYRPYRDVRITHTVVLEDPFNDPHGLRAPSRSPSPSAERLKGGRIAPDEEIDETQGKSAAEIQEMIEEKEAKARATILEIVGDLPDADIAPPENVLFVCKLNPVTTDDDLEIIFSRFGKIVSCEVIRDKKSGDSLQYAFIEFDDKKSCEDAYFKMDNVLIDDRRIHVDFSQSVSKMKWLGKGRGVKYFNDEEAQERERGNNVKNDKPAHSRNKNDEHRSHDRHHHSNNKRHDDREKDREREPRSDRHSRRERESNHRVEERSHRKRSRSRSKRDQSRNDRNNHNNDNNVSRKSDRSNKEYNRNESSRHNNDKKRDGSTDNNISRNSNKNNKDYKHESNKKEYERSRNNDHSVSKNSERSTREYKHDSDRHENERSKVNHNDKNYSRNSEKNVKEYKQESQRNEYIKTRGNSDSEARAKASPARQRESEKSVEHKTRHENNDSYCNTERDVHNNKLKRKSEDESVTKSKRHKKDDQNIEARTPTPTDTKKKQKTSTKHSSKKVKTKRVAKKKRKPSTSTDSSTESSSSSSTESSSSSEEDRKKKSLKRRKKKYSTSSTSSSDSTSSSSSSTESSSSSSSSSDDGKKKKSRKHSNKKKKL